MTVTYYVALPFIRTEDGTAPGEAQECQSEAAAIRRAEGMSRDRRDRHDVLYSGFLERFYPPCRRAIVGDCRQRAR
jgi:hypothetical protein